MGEKITSDELIELIEKEKTSPSELEQFFVETPRGGAPFSPLFAVDRSRVHVPEDPAVEGFVTDGFVDVLNRYHMRRRQRAYEKRIAGGWNGVRLVAEGDSWFQYPLRRNDDLIDFLSLPFAIYCLSAAGDELADMLAESNRERLADVIHATGADGLLLSGGGNDIAGEEFIKYIDNASPSNNPADYITDEFGKLLGQITEGYRDCFSQLLTRFPELKIFFHGYDYAIPQPDGRSLGPSLKRKDIPREHWPGIVRIMIDRYNGSLADLADQFNGKLIHVSCLGAVGGADEWRDELHALAPGCERAAGRFKTELDRVFAGGAVEMATVESGPGFDLAAAVEAASATADDPPGAERLTQEFLSEAELIPDEPVALEDVLGDDPGSLEAAMAESAHEVATVNWPADDAHSPDYGHLDAPPPGGEFELTTDDLRLLIRSNHFEPVGHDGKIMFALRGAELANGLEAEDVSGLTLVDVRPNHAALKCVLGFYQPGSGRLWAYAGSTVPNASFMTKYYKWKNGLLARKVLANMLPTGCYSFRRASHGWDKSLEKWRVPIALRLTRPGTSQDGKATVLRTHEDLSLDTDDVWDRCTPHDNVHPAYGTATFSSAGCLTVRGTATHYTNKATEQWEKFLGHIDDIPKHGRIDAVLLTGAEAAIAASMRVSGTVGDPADVRQRLGRLRVGSQGESVRKLQRALDQSDDGDFGPLTKEALAKAQKSVAPLGKADGIFSPKMDPLFGTDIFTSGPS